MTFAFITTHQPPLSGMIPDGGYLGYEKANQFMPNIWQEYIGYYFLLPGRNAAGVTAVTAGRGLMV